MPAPRHRVVDRSGVPAGHPTDGGFTLAEVVVSLLLMTITVTAVTTFFVGSISASRHLGSKQAAIQAAQDALEQMRSLKPWTILTGRVDCASATCEVPVSAAVPYLTGTDRWGNATSAAALPAAPSPATVTVNGVGYTRQWYVGKCWQPATGGTCDATNATGDLEYLRAVVAVTWSDQTCLHTLPDGTTSVTCAYVDTTLINGSTQPPFQPAPVATSSPGGPQPPSVTSPGNQQNHLYDWVLLTVNETGGTAPFTWSWSGLPPGLHGVGNEVYGWPFWSGTYTVTVKVVDANNLSGTATFSWSVS